MILQNLTPEILRYQADILSIIPELKGIGLMEIDGKYYFENLQNTTAWPKVAGKNLISFPNAIFLREKRIIRDDQYTMKNPSQLAHLFQALGFNTANEEDYIKLYKEQLLGSIPELKAIGLEEIDGKYYFENLQSVLT